MSSSSETGIRSPRSLFITVRMGAVTGESRRLRGSVAINYTALIHISSLSETGVRSPTSNSSINNLKKSVVAIGITIGERRRIRGIVAI